MSLFPDYPPLSGKTDETLVEESMPTDSLIKISWGNFDYCSESSNISKVVYHGETAFSSDGRKNHGAVSFYANHGRPPNKKDCSI